MVEQETTKHVYVDIIYRQKSKIKISRGSFVVRMARCWHLWLICSTLIQFRPINSFLFPSLAVLLHTDNVNQEKSNPEEDHVYK